MPYMLYRGPSTGSQSHLFLPLPTMAGALGLPERPLLSPASGPTGLQSIPARIPPSFNGQASLLRSNAQPNSLSPLSPTQLCPRGPLPPAPLAPTTPPHRDCPNHVSLDILSQTKGLCSVF